jgi:hypothetical protein
MKTQMQILRLSAGRIESNGMLYANAIVLDEDVADNVTPDRIDVGQQHAKVKISTENNNRIAHLLATSGLVPGMVEVEIKTSVKKGEATVEIINFVDKKAS